MTVRTRVSMLARSSTRRSRPSQRWFRSSGPWGRRSAEAVQARSSHATPSPPRRANEHAPRPKVMALEAYRQQRLSPRGTLRLERHLRTCLARQRTLSAIDSYETLRIEASRSLSIARPPKCAGLPSRSCVHSSIALLPVGFPEPSGRGRAAGTPRDLNRRFQLGRRRPRIGFRAGARGTRRRVTASTCWRDLLRRRPGLQFRRDGSCTGASAANVRCAQLRHRRLAEFPVSGRPCSSSPAIRWAFACCWPAPRRSATKPARTRPTPPRTSRCTPNTLLQTRLDSHSAGPAGRLRGGQGVAPITWRPLRRTRPADFAIVLAAGCHAETSEAAGGAEDESRRKPALPFANAPPNRHDRYHPDFQGDRDPR